MAGRSGNPDARRCALTSWRTALCQGFSLTGKMEADDPLNDLVFDFARIVIELKPTALLLENVPGIVHGNRSHFLDALKPLRRGYHVSEALELVTSDFGVPQERRRVVVIGYRNDLDIDPTPPAPTHGLARGPKIPTVRQAIGNLPRVNDFRELSSGDRVPYTAQPTSDFARRMRGRSPDPDDGCADHLGQEAVHQSSPHSPRLGGESENPCNTARRI